MKYVSSISTSGTAIAQLMSFSVMLCLNAVLLKIKVIHYGNLLAKLKQGINAGKTALLFSRSRQLTFCQPARKPAVCFIERAETSHIAGTLCAIEN
jgi:hypothetical protein